MGVERFTKENRKTSEFFSMDSDGILFDVIFVFASYITDLGRTFVAQLERVSGWLPGWKHFLLNMILHNMILRSSVVVWTAPG